MGPPVVSDAAAPATQTTEVSRLADAIDGSAQEHELGFFEALRLYPKGVFWSIVMSTAVIMEGYDTKLIGTLFAQPAFQKAYGQHVTGDSYQISAPWQAGLSNGSAAGQLLGLLMAGYLSERFGFRKTMMIGLTIIIGFIFITFFAPSLTVLEVGQTLFGIPLGLFQTTPVIYALEISPLCLRAYLTNYVNFCWAFGQIIATGILRGVLNMDNEWAYRIPFAIQWFWPVILIPLIYFAPESPWWLVRRGRTQEAREVLKRLTSSRNINFDMEKNIALMVVTTEHERTINAETSYWACFEGTNLRRTIIVVGIYCIQTLNGNPLRGYSTYFLEQAGLPTTEAFNMTIVGFAVAIVGGFFSWVLLPFFGRRTIYVWSLVLMFIIMVLVGALGVPQAKSPTPFYAWGIGSLLIISSFLYNCSIGPLTNTLCSEIPSALLRSKSIVLARWSYAVTTIVAGVLTPYQLNPTAWNWSAKTGFFWTGGCLISIAFAYFYVPEPKDRTTAELDVLFERKTPARHFSKTQVDITEVIYGNVEKKV
ncbi:general substrate transporter [Xylogone sp. PMI_703]|nr:general substrate transporter [Xylogone sp. PMI_703]